MIHKLLLAAQRFVNGLATRDRDSKMRFDKIAVHTVEAADASFHFGVTDYKD